MQRRLTWLVSPLVALALAGAACSGGGGQLSHADYQKKLDQIGTELKKQSSVFSSSSQVKSLDDLKKLAPQFNAVADSTDNIAKELDDVAPPDDAAKANQQLVDNLPKLADDFRAFAVAVEAGDLQKLQDIGKQFNDNTAPGAKEVNSALADLKSAGYNVPNS